MTEYDYKMLLWLAIAFIGFGGYLFTVFKGM